MGLTVAQKIIQAHLLAGEMTPGQEISLRMDQTLTQDTTGTMAYLQFEAIGVPRVKTKRSVAYIDHNLLQTGFMNADDHCYIQTVAKKHGIWFSRPGNGICHQVQLERFGVPGETLLGSDSHTPTCGGLGMLAIGAGGLDVAVVMAGGSYETNMPASIGIELVGKLPSMVSAKDIILEVLRRLTVRGGVGYVIEYFGEGVRDLTVPERATITNMGAELGATTSIFPSDEQTRKFLRAQNREADYTPLSADPDAEYARVERIDLSTLAPLAACPHSPDAVKTIEEIGPIAVQQVCIGSCTNSSLLDMLRVARILKGKTIAETVSLAISPGSKQVLAKLAENGALAELVQSGARILECGCGPCIGMGQSPASAAVSVRTFNRNFEGRSGTKDAQVYLTSPETAAATALTGVLTDPRTLDIDLSDLVMPDAFIVNDNLVVPPAEEGAAVEVVRGPNIKPFPRGVALPETVQGAVLLKMGNNITTDHIAPSDSRLLPYRSNVPYLSDYCLTPVDPEFPARAKALGGGVLVAGQNYGQGSSREHASLVPLYLGVKIVIALSFARIHRDNLINSGILPLVFEDASEYEAIQQGDVITLADAQTQIDGERVQLRNETQGRTFTARLEISDRQRAYLRAGGRLNYASSGK